MEIVLALAFLFGTPLGHVILAIGFVILSNIGGGNADNVS